MADDQLPSTDISSESYWDSLAAKIRNNPVNSPEQDLEIGLVVGAYLTQNVKDSSPDTDQIQSDLEEKLGSVNGVAIARYIQDYLQSGTQQFDPDVITASKPTAGQPVKRATGSTPKAGEPVNLATGQFVHSVTDFVVSGAGLDFEFKRTYKSGAFYQGPLGANWDHLYNLWLVDNGDNSVTVTTGQLHPVRYILNQVVASPYYVALSDDNVVVATTDDAFEQRSPDGRVVRFENLTGDGRIYQVVQVRDRFSNNLSFEYDNQYRLIQVTVNNQSRDIEFSYDDQSRIVSVSLFPVTYVIAGVSTFIRRVWTYEYDDFGDLVEVTGPATDDFPLGRSTTYEYSSPSSFAQRQHDLLNITDPNGTMYLENEYGNQEGTVAFGRVVSQRVGSGVFLFEYEDVLYDPSWTYTDAQRPTSCVTVEQRNGHSVCYVINSLGNTLLSTEIILADGEEKQVVWRYSYDRDGRRIATLSPEGRITQAYFGRQYFYERQINPGNASLDPWLDPNLSTPEHERFPNILAIVRRAELFDFSTLADDLSIYGDIFPNALAPDLAGNDVITKFTYESTFQQRATTSDPRYTTSADPASPESLDPSSPYSTHLIIVTFGADPAKSPLSVTYPETTYPAPLPNGATGVSGAKLTFDAYDANGRLLQYTLPEGNTVAFSYFHGNAAEPTIDGFLASRTVGVGNLDLLTRFMVNEAGQVVAFTDPRGNTTKFGVDAASLVRTVTLPANGYVIQAKYDGNSQVTSRLAAIIEPDGSTAPGSPEVTNFAYNSEMSLILTSFGDSSGTPLRQSRRTYDASNCLINLTLPRGNSICLEYDERLLLRQTTHGCCAPEAATTSYEYDLDGLRASVTDPRAGRTTTALDALGRATGITGPLGTLERIDYDKLDNAIVHRWFGPVTGGTYPLLRRIEFQYDERNQLVRQRNAYFSKPIAVADPWRAPDSEFNAAAALGKVQFYDTLIYHDGNLRIFRAVDANGNATTRDYDSADRCYKSTDPTGSYSISTYDAAGNVIRLDQYCVDAASVVRAVISILHEYDSMNRLTATKDGAGNRVSRGLDSRALVCNQTDAVGNITEWTYDGFRDQITETRVLIQAGGASSSLLTTAFSYDPNGNVVGVKDPNGNSTALQYDTLDRLTRVINADGTWRSTSYDRSGNSVQKIDEEGNIVNQIFDAANRLTSMAAQPTVAPPASAEQNATFVYDGVGAMIEHENAFVKAIRTFDSLGRCYRESLTFASPLAAVPSPLLVLRQFDGVSNLTQLQYPSGQTLRYKYDAANHLIRVDSVANASGYPGNPTAPTNRTILQSEWLGELPSTSRLGNGLVIKFAYDAVGRSTANGCTLGNGDAFLLQQLWDGAGNRKLVVENYANQIKGWRYEYDSANRLMGSLVLQNPAVVATNALAPPTSPSSPASLSAQTKIDTVINGYSVVPQANSEFAYDAAGNRTQRGNVVYSSNSRNEYSTVNGSPFLYDRAGRLINDTKFVYSYNLRGQLTQATVAPSNSLALQVFHDALGQPVGVVEGGHTRVLVPIGENAIEAYDNGALSALFVRQGRDQLCFFATRGKDQFVVRDVLQSTRLTSDSNAAAIGVFRYDSFGGLLSGVPETRILYSGKYRYDSISWDEYRRRQYIPSLGRFAQPDPAGFIDGANLYTFVGNNPLSARDTDGTNRQNVQRAASEDTMENDKATPVLRSETPLVQNQLAPATDAAFVNAAIKAVKEGFVPVDTGGTPLTGPLKLYSSNAHGEAARQLAQSEPWGYMIQDLSYYPAANAEELALRSRLNILTGKLPQGPLDKIWAPVSRKAVVQAVVSGRGAGTSNDLMATDPSDPLYLKRPSIQADVELPWLRGLGTVVGLANMAGGGLQIASAVSEDTPNFLRPVAVVGGSLQFTGGVAYIVGALGADGPMMVAGGAIADTGGLAAIPVGAAVVLQGATKALLTRWRDFSMQMVNQGMRNFQNGIMGPPQP